MQSFGSLSSILLLLCQYHGSSKALQTQLCSWESALPLRFILTCNSYIVQGLPNKIQRAHLGTSFVCQVQLAFYTPLVLLQVIFKRCPLYTNTDASPSEEPAETPSGSHRQEPVEQIMCFCSVISPPHLLHPPPQVENMMLNFLPEADWLMPKPGHALQWPDWDVIGPTSIHLSSHQWCMVFPSLNPRAKKYSHS